MILFESLSWYRGTRILSKRLREREFSDVDELKKLTFHSGYIHRLLSDQNIRKTTQFSAQQKYSTEELTDIQTELELKIKDRAPNRIINGWFCTKLI